MTSHSNNPFTMNQPAIVVIWVIFGPDAHKAALYLHQVLTIQGANAQLRYGTHAHTFTVHYVAFHHDPTQLAEHLRSQMQPMFHAMSQRMGWSFSPALSVTPWTDYLEQLLDLLKEDDAAWRMLNLFVKGSTDEDHGADGGEGDSGDGGSPDGGSGGGPGDRPDEGYDGPPVIGNIDPASFGPPPFGADEQAA